MSQHPLRPIHICLFIFACFIALAIMQDWGLFHSDEDQVIAHIEDVDTVPPTPVPDEDSVYKQPYLAAFYRSLEQADSLPIRVVHYGDSQIEEDRITMQLRRYLQQHYGGGGVGLIPLHQTIPTYTIGQSLFIDSVKQSINQGPKRYLIYGPRSMHRDTNVYGVMGQVAVLDSTLVPGSEDVTLQLKTYPKAQETTEAYFNRIRILHKGEITITGAGSALGKGLYKVANRAQTASIRFQGKGDIYGISLETDCGVMVDNIPMRGCLGMIFTSIESSQLRSYYAATNTSLIILQFGGNALPGLTKSSMINQYVANMRSQIRYLKQLAPNSSILFIGPSDMCERVDGEFQTYRMLPLMDQQLQQMAAQEQIAYFSLFQQMGGSGSMQLWHDQGMAGKDYIHFTVRGAERAGQMLIEWMF